MKSRLLITLLILAPTTIFAAPVSKQQAKKNAMAFLSSATTKGMKKAKATTTGQQLVPVDSTDAYYIFNLKGQSGFVVASGSDKTQPVLGYADDGNFDPRHVPEALRGWLSQLQTGVKMAEKGELPRRTTSTRQMARKSYTKNAIPVMVQTHWNQGEPYNGLTPPYTNDQKEKVEHSATGCVATAMAQIMKYWNHPAKSPALPSYSTSWGNDGQRTIEGLPEAEFNWGAMLNDYNDNSPKESQDAVAMLMRYVGQSIYMGYGASSGAGVGNPVPALRNYFDYNPNLYYASHDQFTYQEWEDLIYEELKAGRPVLMNGDNYERTGGHEWVCDGYDGNGYFHMNWGWGGMSDGYFALTIMVPSAQGIGGSTASDGFSMGQGIVVGLEPAGRTKADDKEARLTLTELSSTKTHYTRTDATTSFLTQIKQKLQNDMGMPYNFDAKFTVYNENGEVMQETTGGMSNLYIAQQGTITRTVSIMFGRNLPDGTYYLKGRSKAHDATEWLNNTNVDEVYIKAVISNGTDLDLNFVPAMTIPVDIHVNSIELEGNMTVDSKQKVKVNFTNNGGEYYSDTYLFVDNTRVSGNTICIPEGKTMDVYYSYTPKATGAHSVVLTTSTNPKDTKAILYSTTFNLSDTYPARLYVNGTCLSEVATVNGQRSVYGNQMRVQARITNRAAYAYNSFVKSSAWKNNGGWWLQTQSQEVAVNIPAGKDTTVVFTFDNLDLGYTYDFHVDTDGSSSANVSGYKFLSGILYWTTDGIRHGTAPTSSTFTAGSDVAAVYVPGTQNVPSFYIADEYNPNIVVYFDERAPQTGRALSVLRRKAKNIVFGEKAESIALDDKFDILIPRPFTATEATFTHDVGTMAAGQSWSTITLPFKPETIKADGEDIDWFHNAQDTGKQLEIKEFTAAQADRMYFADVDELIANRPLIINYAGTRGSSTFDHSGKTIVFAAQNAVFQPIERISTFSTDYKFVGTTLKQQAQNVYTLNADGKSFSAVTEATIDPMRAYFVANSKEAAAAKTLVVVTEGDNTNTGIEEMTTGAVSHIVSIYNINGTKVQSVKAAHLGTALQALPHGIYIVGGKKIVK